MVTLYYLDAPLEYGMRNTLRARGGPASPPKVRL
jgi:hypothetical protein